MSLNSAEICVFYKQQSQNFNFSNKPTQQPTQHPTQPTQPFPKTLETQVENNKVNRMMPM